MSFPLKSLVLSSFAFLLLSIPAAAQTTTIEGVVKSPEGKPVPNAVITINRTDVKGNYTVKTDKKGHYGHYGLPLGTFDVTVMIDGNMADQMKGVKTRGAEPSVVDFNLKNAEQQGLSAAADATRGMSKEQKAEFEKKNKEREAQLAKNKELNDAYTAGKAALDDKNYDVAIENLSKASTLDDKQVAVWSTLADAYVGAAQAKPAEADALYAKSFDAFKKAIELKPDDAAYYNNYALALAKNKKIEDAKTNLNKAAELDKAGAGKYYYNMGALLVNSGQNDAAGEQFKKAIEVDPNYADADYQYGVFLASKATTDASGKIVAPPGTTEALQKYLDLKPDGPMAPSAKELIAQLGGTVTTSFSNPNAPKSSSSSSAPAATPKKKK